MTVQEPTRDLSFLQSNILMGLPNYPKIASQDGKLTELGLKMFSQLYFCPAPNTLYGGKKTSLSI